MKNHKVTPEDVVREPKVVAVVGASKNPEKDAFTVPKYLLDHGFEVIPVNPSADSVHGLRVYPSLSSIPDELARSIEIVDVFRPSDELLEMAKQVAELKRRAGCSPVFWAQLGLWSEEAARFLEHEGIPYVMDACIRTQHQLMKR